MTTRMGRLMEAANNGRQRDGFFFVAPPSAVARIPLGRVFILPSRHLKKNKKNVFFLASSPDREAAE